MKKRRLPLYVSLRFTRYFPLWLLLIAMGIFPLLVSAQEKQFTVRFEKGSLEQAIQLLRNVTGSSIVYRKDEINSLTVKSQHFENATLNFILQTLVKPLPVKIEKRGLAYFIVKKAVITDNKDNRDNKKETVYPFTLTGRVTDLSGVPLVGATVVLKGSGAGGVTDDRGYYTIRISAKGAILLVGFIGYENRQVAVEGVPVQHIKLVSRQTSLNEVIVSARKRANTESALLNDRKMASIVSDGISAQNIERTASITTTQALQRVTGVTITDEKYVAIRGLGDRSVIAELNGARLSSANPDRSSVPLDLVPASLLDNITVYKTLSPDHPADASAGIIELKTKSVPSNFTVQFTAQTGTNTSIGVRGYVNSFQGSDMGFLGQKIKQKDLSSDFLNLQTQYPGGLQQIQRLFIESGTDPAKAAESYRINQIMLSFDPVLSTSYKMALPDQIYTVSAGNTFHVFGGHTLGVVLSANYYRRSEDRYKAELNQYSLYQGVVTGSVENVNGVYTSAIYSPMHIPAFISPDNRKLGKYLGYEENSGTETLSYGGLVGLTYQFNTANEIQLQYIGSRGGETEASNLLGSFQNTGIQYPVYNQVYQLRQTYRIFNTVNLQGEHKLKFGSGTAWPQLSYNLSSSKSTQDEPDFRFTDLADENEVRNVDANGVGIGSNIYSFVVGSAPGVGTSMIGVDPNGRKYRNLTETNYNAKADLTEMVKVGGLDQIIKTGFNYLHRERTFHENILGIPGTNSGGDDGLLQQVNGNVDQLVSYANIGLKDVSGYDNLGQPMVGGFLYQIKKSPNNYTGMFETKAFYGMLDLHLTSKLRLTGGVRLETTDIETNVDTANVYNPLVNIDNTSSSGAPPTTGTGTNPHIVYSQNYKPYYSVNLTYAIRKDMNFRLAYNTSLARPELREMTNIYEFDPFLFGVIPGNPYLVNQLTRSEDFRWEWFPGGGEEVISASAFAKQIEHQLTKVFKYNSQGTQSLYPEYPLIEFINDPNKGYIYGVELEFRKDLGKLWEPLRHFFIGANFMGAYSEIVKNGARDTASLTNDRYAPRKSPVFEQPPYSLNANLDYNNPASGTDVTVNFNVVGERLIQVQLDGVPDIYDRPAPLLDFVFSQKLGKKFLVKGFAKNILDPAFREVYTYPGTGGKFYGYTYIHHQYHKGAQLAVGLTYNLF